VGGSSARSQDAVSARACELDGGGSQFDILVANGFPFLVHPLRVMTSASLAVSIIGQSLAQARGLLSRQGH